MTDRQRLSLFVAITFVVLAAPSPAAFTTDTMTLVPAGEMLAALDLDQDDRDPACVAECAARRDKLTAEAARQLQGKEFYSKFDSNCFSYEGLPMCAALRAQCQAGCGPKATASCLASCETAFQSCCATNKTAAADRDYPVCVAKCPVVQKPGRMPTASPEPRATTRDTGTNAPADKKRALADVLNSLNKIADTLGPWLDGPVLEQFNNLRRTLAFAQVSATLAENNGRFAMVSGGQGRIWIIKSDGTPAQVDAKTAALMRSQFDSSDQPAIAGGLIKAGLSPEDAEIVMSNIIVHNMESQRDKKFSTGGFVPGNVWYFPNDGNWSKDAAAGSSRASTEHASIKGTINGGGDFI